MKKLFRQKSLEKISSPERLDELMQVTSPRLWIALLTVGLLLVFALVWGIFGRIPMKVHGQGILVRSGGLYTVTTEGSGRVNTLLVEPGDIIAAGQEVARISSPDRELLIAETEAKVQRMSETHDNLVHFTEEALALRLAALNRQQDRLNHTLASLESRSDFIEEQIKIFEDLLQRGLVTMQMLQQNQLELTQVELQKEEARDQIENLELDRTEALSQAEQTMQQSRAQLENERLSLLDMRESYQRTSRVISPFPGHVLETLVAQHQLISPGASIISLELTGQELTTQFFVPDTEGKRIQAGMVIQVSPSTVRKERYGVLLGQVEAISEFPATPTAMMNILQNEVLVEQMASTGAQFAGVALLREDPSTFSGYVWSSARGPNEQLYAGTICEISVVTAESPPITLVIPFLRRFFGL